MAGVGGGVGVKGTIGGGGGGREPGKGVARVVAEICSVKQI